MSIRRARLLVAGLALVLLAAAPGPRQAVVVDDFESPDTWTASGYPGTRIELASDAGVEGSALRLDFDFRGSRGYVVARRAVRLRLPDNFAFSFAVRGASPVNNLEFKLVGDGGRDVWWLRQRDFEFPLAWERVVIRKSQLEFAWGPSGGGEPREIEAIEIALTAGSGGQGSVWIDDLRLEPREPVDLGDSHADARASASLPGHDASAAMDGDPSTAWRRAPGPGPAWLDLRFPKPVEIGGVVIDWEAGEGDALFRVRTADASGTLRTVHEGTIGIAGRSPVQISDDETSWLRIEMEGEGAAGIREVGLRDPHFSASPEQFVAAVARDSPRGRFPRAYLGEQTYWTVVGVDSDAREGLLDEDGRLEVERGRFSLEPFLYADGRLVTWADVQRDQDLAHGYLPVPSVSWRLEDLSLRVTAFAAGTPGASTLYARYRVHNGWSEVRKLDLLVAVRPFQVNPPWQSLNMRGGVAPIHEIARVDGGLWVDHQKLVVPLPAADAVGATTFEEGPVTEWLARGRVPISDQVSDASGMASAVLRFSLELSPGESRDVFVAVPFAATDPDAARAGVAEDAAAAAQVLEETVQGWQDRLARIPIHLPSGASTLVDTLRSNVAYVLVNRDGPAIQPGSRDYKRSWIRDGALTSAALLEMGYSEEVRDYLRWYARYQYDDGRIPCCVDERGADPVAEHDSNGEFIYALTDYYRHTRDLAFVEELWPVVTKAVAYIRFLREQTIQSTADQSTDLPVGGLAPPSISHEGYSAQPVHSYWDDFFLLRGLKDATLLATELGDSKSAESFAELRDAFRVDLYESIRRSVALHQIDYLPGSVELGDFDPTSTSIAVAPGGEIDHLPGLELARTFERYFAHFLKRRHGWIEWQSYTPYELRNVTTLVRLGHRDLALEALDFFLADRRPPGWNAWAEVVWRDPRRPAFLGDMPHTWVGSGFIRSFRSLFVYEREADDALVLGAGIASAWVDEPPGVATGDLPTHHGLIRYSLRRTAPGVVRAWIDGRLREKPGHILLVSPYDRPLREAKVNGREVQPTQNGEVPIETLPAQVELRY